MKKRKPVAFMSYVHSDNKYKRLTKFHKHLSDELEAQSGEEFPIFMDRKDIKWGQNWRERIEEALDAVTFFIPIITPKFFNSIECREELEQFLKREKKLRRKNFIFPVYYIDCRQLNDKEEQKNDKLAQEIANRQFLDWRDFRLKSITLVKCQEKLAEFASQLCNAWNRERKLQTRISHPSSKSSLLFLEKFVSFDGWKNYINGIVEQSSDRAYEGRFSLKKDKNSDPNGGFKKLERRTGLNIVFSGWIFCPSGLAGGLGDRLAIEDADFNGYGFAVAHNSNLVWIERRDEGAYGVLRSSKSICDVPKDEWYQFIFYMKTGGKFDLYLYDHKGKEFFYVKDIPDNTYNSFDRVVVHGGFPYYVDNLKVKVI